MKYENPELDVILFNRLDIIRTSQDPDLSEDFGEGGTVDPNNY